MGMAFNFEKSTFSQDEVEQTSRWGAAYYLAISGFEFGAGVQFAVRSSGPPNPLPTITAAINSSSNQSLNAGPDFDDCY